MRFLVIAPGEDLVAEDVEALGRHCDEVVGCNLTIRLPVKHDHCVVNDWQCARQYKRDFDRAPECQFWTAGDDVLKVASYFKRIDIHRPDIPDFGLNPDRYPLWHLGSSGHNAIALAWMLGASEIWLLGFTCTGQHFHGPHEGLCENPGHEYPVGGWIHRHHRIRRSVDNLALPLEIRDYTHNPCGAYKPGDWSCWR